MDFEEEITDRWGAQLSQECPLPANHQPMGTNNRTEQCRCLQCGRLFRLDLAGQVVSGPAKSFHGGGECFGPPGKQVSAPPMLDQGNTTISFPSRGIRWASCSALIWSVLFALCDCAAS